MEITEVHLNAQIKSLIIKIKKLMDEMKTTEEKCIFEYEKRIKDEGCANGFIFLPLEGATIEIKSIILFTSEKQYKKRIELNGGIENFKHLGSGVIELVKNKKNTRGNSANIEATLGAAIICMKNAEQHLEKQNYIAWIDRLLKASEAYGAAKGRFHSKISTREEKNIQNEEIRKEIKIIREKYPTLSKSEATRRALKHLKYPQNKTSRARHLI